MNAVVLTVKYSYVASTKYTRQGVVTVSIKIILFPLQIEQRKTTARWWALHSIKQTQSTTYLYINTCLHQLPQSIIYAKYSNRMSMRCMHTLSQAFHAKQTIHKPKNILPPQQATHNWNPNPTNITNSIPILSHIFSLHLCAPHSTTFYIFIRY